jgi:O-antigen chain-terminating methyltransferase
VTVFLYGAEVMDPSTLDVGPGLDADAVAAKVREIIRGQPADEARGGEVRSALRDQAEFNRAMAEAIGSAVHHLQVVGARLDAIERRLEESLAELREQTDRQIGEGHGEVRQLSGVMEELRIRALRAERAVRTAAAQAEEAPGNGPPAPPPFDYFLFEQRFRGPRSEIRRRQQVYLNDFRGCSQVLDLGCGRGEFVELLREHGVPAEGIDADEDMVDYCRDRGLPVRRADLFDHLGRLPAGSLDGVFASQVVEHLTPDRLWQLVHLCSAAVKPGGVLVFETLNIVCPAAAVCFYLDPTHVRPVPPDLLRFMLEQASFDVRVCRFTAPVPGSGRPELFDVRDGEPAPDCSAYQDYGVVAVRSAHGQPLGATGRESMNGQSAGVE